MRIYCSLFLPQCTSINTPMCSLQRHIQNVINNDNDKSALNFSLSNSYNIVFEET